MTLPDPNPTTLDRQLADPNWLQRELSKLGLDVDALLYNETLPDGTSCVHLEIHNADLDLDRLAIVDPDGSTPA